MDKDTAMDLDMDPDVDMDTDTDTDTNTAIQILNCWVSDIGTSLSDIQ